MKKNKMMRLASILLVAVLMTTSVISGTFAKYTTQDDANDSARVAKWGISLQVVGDLYGQYYLDAADNYKTTSTTPADISVMSSDSSNLVAPGTKNEDGMSFGLTGTPEVDYKIISTITAQNIFLKEGSYGVMVEVPAGTITAENWTSDLYELVSGEFVPSATSDGTGTYYTLEDAYTLDLDGNGANDAFYYPVVYGLSSPVGEDISYAGTTQADSINAIAAAIAGRLANGATVTTSTNAAHVTTYTLAESEVFNANTPAAAIRLSDMSLTWNWEFDSIYNGADTILGNLMAGAALEGTVVKYNGTDAYVAPEATDYCLNTSFSLDITVEQVD